MRLALGLTVTVVLSSLVACGSSTVSGGGGGGGAGGQAATTTATTTGTGTGAGGAGGGTSDGCRSGSDCDAGWFCAAYTLPPLCGGQPDTTFDNNCMTDADCADAGTNQICDNTLCVIPHGGAQTPPHCRPGCLDDAGCGPGFSCNAMQHCEPAACAQPSECGANFTCATGSCAPKPCTTDADCGDYCVNSACSATIGFCGQAVP